MPRPIIVGLTVLALFGAVAAPASAQPQRGPAQAHGDNHPGWGQDNRPASHHWKRGQRMGYNDWRRAPPVDYRAHHLRQPPRGYEWREQNGQYILAAIATGLIASIILQSGR